MQDRTTTIPWTPFQRILFRFAALYFLLYSFPFPLGMLPWTDGVGQFLSNLWNPLVLWTGEHILSLPKPIAIQPTGSGDTLYAYIQLLLIFVLALVGCGGWTLLRRGNPERLAGWLRIAVRYYVGFFLIIYGVFKVIKTQFPDPDLVRLTTPYGDSSPMGLLWTFMGYSGPYNIFTGGLEVLGGLLLLFRRTTTLGALVSIGVMSNVAMLNFAYDVPVKLFSVHLVIFAAALLLRDVRRLVDVFLRNRPAQPVDLSPPWPERWNAGRRRWILRGIKALVIGAFLVNHTMMVLGHYQTRGTARSKPPLYGLYDVDSFVKDGQPHPPLLTDTERWRLVIFDWPGRLAVRGMDNALQVFPIELDETAGTMAIRKGQGEEAEKAAWTFERPAPGKLNLAGEWEGSTYALELTARDPEQFLLRSRGFHWIQEFPFNR